MYTVNVCKYMWLQATKIYSKRTGQHNAGKIQWLACAINASKIHITHRKIAAHNANASLWSLMSLMLTPSL